MNKRITVTDKGKSISYYFQIYWPYDPKHRIVIMREVHGQ